MLKNLIKPKNWYKVGDVEYSTNLRFFKEHQIFITKSGNHITFSSRLESKEFKRINIVEVVESYSDMDEQKYIEDIHNALLDGAYGKGEYID